MAVAFRAELLAAVRACSDRGLTYAAKWCAELAVAVDVPADAAAGPASPAAASLTAAAGPPPREEAAVALAKVYYDLQEYDRAAHALVDCDGDLAFFLRSYATYLGGEKRKEAEALEVVGGAGRISDPARGSFSFPPYAVSTPLLPTMAAANDGANAVNDTLGTLAAALEARAAAARLDAFGFYLWGLVLAEQVGPGSPGRNGRGWSLVAHRALVAAAMTETQAREHGQVRRGGHAVPAAVVRVV